MYNIYGVGSDIERGRFNEINDCIGNMFLTFLTGSLIDHPINDLVPLLTTTSRCLFNIVGANSML